MAAGEQARLGTELLQQLERLVDARSALITERCWDLQSLLLSLSRPPGSGVTVAVSNRVK